MMNAKIKDDPSLKLEMWLPKCLGKLNFGNGSTIIGVPILGWLNGQSMTNFGITQLAYSGCPSFMMITFFRLHGMSSFKNKLVVDVGECQESHSLIY